MHTLQLNQSIPTLDNYPKDQIAAKLENTTNTLWRGLRFTIRTFYETPAEAAMFALAAVIMRIFISSFVAPFLGICISLVFARLAIKTLEQSYNTSFVQIKKQVYLINSKYPRCQLIALVTALGLSLLSSTAGFLMGFSIGVFGAIVLDVENYNLIQQAKRNDPKINMESK